VIISEEVRSWKGTLGSFEAYQRQGAHEVAKRARMALIAKSFVERRRAEDELTNELRVLKRIVDEPLLYLGDPLYAERLMSDLQHTNRLMYKMKWPAYFRLCMEIQRTVGKITEMLARLQEAQRLLTRTKGMTS
jgi:hypothetical protein